MSRCVFFFLTFLSTACEGCPKDPFCLSCPERGKCTLCYDSVLNLAGECDPQIKLVPHCYFYKKYVYPARCEVCNMGYRLTAQATCQRCSDKTCADCRENLAVCSACFGGVVPVGGKCPLDSAPLKNCKVANDIAACVLCDNGFSLNEKYVCAPSFPNCQVVNHSNQCLLCIAGTHVSESYKCEGTPKPIPDFEDKFSLFWVFLALVFVVLVALIVVLIVKRPPGRMERDEALF